MEIGLKDAIAALREELSASILAGANEQLQFEVGEITLEFQVQVERALDGSGKINVWVVEIGGGAARTDTQTHTVTIPLKPTSDGRPVRTHSGVRE
jgi:hypothetical protein